MATSTLSDKDQQGEYLQEWIYDTCETRIGTKEQLQGSGIGIAAAFPGELGANKRRCRLTDRRGYTVLVELLSRTTPKAPARYRAFTKIPPSVVESRDTAVALDLSERFLLNRLREHSGDFVDRIILYALCLSRAIHREQKSPPPRFTVGEVVSVCGFFTDRLGEVQKVEWYADGLQPERSGWLYQVQGGDKVFSVWECDLKEPPLADVIRLPTAVLMKVRQRPGRLPRNIPRIGKA